MVFVEISASDAVRLMTRKWLRSAACRSLTPTPLRTFQNQAKSLLESDEPQNSFSDSRIEGFWIQRRVYWTWLGFGSGTGPAGDPGDLGHSHFQRDGSRHARAQRCRSAAAVRAVALSSLGGVCDDGWQPGELEGGVPARIVQNAMCSDFGPTELPFRILWDTRGGLAADWYGYGDCQYAGEWSHID